MDQTEPILNGNQKSVIKLKSVRNGMHICMVQFYRTEPISKELNYFYFFDSNEKENPPTIQLVIILLSISKELKCIYDVYNLHT